MAARNSSARLRPAHAIHLGCAAAIALMVGCNNASLPAAPQIANTTSTALFSLKINAASHSLPMGSTLDLQVAGFTDTDAPVPVGQTPHWKSSDLKVAGVSTKGVVQGLKAGTVTVTATVDNPPREATIALRVLGPGQTPPPEPATDNTGLDPGTPDPNGGDVYASPDPGSLPGDPNGGFTPPDGSGTLPDPTGPSPPAGFTIAIYPQTPRVGVGGRLRLVALQGPAGSGTPTAAAWLSSDTHLATVDEGGNVTGLAAGSVNITASSLAYPSLRQTTALMVVAPVNPNQIHGIRVTPSQATMNVGETFWLQADVATTTGGFDPNVRWESGNTAVVTVSDTGQLTAIGPGSTLVTATAATFQGDLSASVPVTVRNVAGSP